MKTIRTQSVKYAICGVLSLIGASYGADTRAFAHRATLVDECVNAAQDRMGIDFTRARETSPVTPSDAAPRKMVYLNVSSQDTRLPVDLRLYCSVNAAGEIENVTSMPRLVARSN